MCPHENQNMRREMGEKYPTNFLVLCLTKKDRLMRISHF